MKTSQLIEALAADRPPGKINLGARFCLALGVGALVSAWLFMMMLGPRSNFVASLQSMRFDLKFIDTLAFALPAAVLGLRVLRPDARIGVLGVAFLAPVVLLGAGVIGELLLVPADLWGTRLIGSNSISIARMKMVPTHSRCPSGRTALCDAGGHLTKSLACPAPWRGLHSQLPGVGDPLCRELPG